MGHQFDASDLQLDSIIESVNHGVTLKEIYGISGEQMEAVYCIAHDLYNEGRLDEAEKFFRFLCVYDFYCVEYLMGLAAVYQLKGAYQKAADIYAVAFAQSKGDYRAMLFSGQCQLAMGKVGRARMCFRQVIKSSTEPSLRSLAQAHLDALANRT
ncbi:type III secretion low calcium response chaperone LcrH/SycD [Cupriavidus sp. YR651]|uniref:SycD/LcrH family type III secretion system chaperone n=1 Tax=Cupriavidus sp. YR651 TaxID=1855315 RepID=UPI00088C7698|nr:SycD/LcrH family type III secretion system chaperone [Cupriavidus sp. YR651]SDD38512.1 type III secretion low calcium response chaperone LcrH/SycD [Cupriavidus sp. YR651]